MARKKKNDGKRPIESYEHSDKERVNNPPVGLVTPETDPDTDKKKTSAYDGRSLYPRQVFFLMAGEKEGRIKLAHNLKAEIDEELIEAYRGSMSLPFELGEHKRIAVKIVHDRGIESLKVMEIEQ